MINLLIVEDNEKLRIALKSGFQTMEDIRVIFDCGSGEESINFCFSEKPDAILMDVQLEGKLNGIESSVEIRKEFPRLPIIFYSIQDDDNYYRDFRESGIISHYAYVKKSNYLLPQMIFPLIKDAISGLGFIDPDIESRVQEVRDKDKQSPMSLLEPNEQKVAKMLANGMTNEQIASIMGFKDKRTISRINGQIYTSWNLNENATDEKVARTRASIIVREGRLIYWDKDGNAYYIDDKSNKVTWCIE